MEVYGVEIKYVGNEEGTTVEYSLDNTSWNKYNQEITLNENATIYVKIMKNGEIIKTAQKTIDNIDKQAPIVNANINETTITIDITEDESGLANNNKYEFYLSDSSAALTGGNWRTYYAGNSIELDTLGTKYVFIRKIKDNVGNTSISLGTEVNISGESYLRFGPFVLEAEELNITVTGPNEEYIRVGREVTYQITLNRTATLNKNKITLTGEGSTGCTVDVTESGTTYTVTVTGGTGNGAVTLNVAAGAFTDSAGNTSVATSKDGLTIDNIAPTVTIGNPNKQSIKSGQTATYAITLSETATLDSSKITVTGTGNTACKVEVTGSGTIYTVAVTGGTGSGAVTLNIAAGAFTDSAGNTNNTTTKTGLTIDNTAPLSFNITAKLGSVYNSVIVNGETTDEHSGIAGYKYSSDNGTNWTETTLETSYTFTNLIEGNTYYFKMKAIDNLGNETESNTATITIEKPVPIPVPDGYVASEVEGENTIEGGYVIYEGTEPVTEANHATALTTRNQYVWIPVSNINDMVMCSSNSGSSVCNLVLDGETLKCTTHSSTATDLVGRLYVGTNVPVEDGVYSHKLNFGSRSQTYNANVITDKGWEPGFLKDDTFLDEQDIKEKFRVMATSVAKNKGFYIGRYEAGANGASKKNQLVLSATVGEGSNYVTSVYGSGWDGLYRTLKKLEDKNQQMIWGCQYDQVVKFIGADAETSDYGRHYLVIGSAGGTSGRNGLDKMKNIYDLEGNFSEWTQETYHNYAKCLRGGNYININKGEYYPISYREGEEVNYAYVAYGTRTTLYL